MFTRRERLILRLLCQGFSPKEIAGKLEISTSTTHTHIRRLCRKAGVSSDRQLIIFAMQQPGALRRGNDCHPGIHGVGLFDDCPHCRAMRAGLQEAA